jgi:hypothetical protein
MRALLSLLLGSAISMSASAALGVDPRPSTPDMPDRWLLLHHLNNPDSITWAESYREQRSIPFDFDEDEDCDLADVAAFQRSYSGGPLTPATGDYDGNGIVDLSDFNAFQNCATVPGPRMVADVCDDIFDFDFDLDVDLEDSFNMQHVLVPREPQTAVEQSQQSHQSQHP